MELCIQIITIASIAVQFAAAILAFRLIPLTGRIIAWTFIASANVLMALRRCLAFYVWLFDPHTSSADLASTVTTLVISIVMLLGVALIGPLFIAKEEDKKRLVQSQQEFQSLVTNIPAIVFTWDRDGTVRFYDNKVLEVTGYSREMFENNIMKWSDIVVAADWEKGKKVLINALKTDLSYVREYRIIHKKGHLLCLQERSRIICDADHNLDYISGVFFDITEKLGKNCSCIFIH